MAALLDSDQAGEPRLNRRIVDIFAKEMRAFVRWLATRDLTVTLSTMSDTAGPAFMVIDEILSAHRLGDWIDDGSPVSLTETSRATRLRSPGDVGRPAARQPRTSGVSVTCRVA